MGGKGCWRPPELFFLPWSVLWPWGTLLAMGLALECPCCSSGNCGIGMLGSATEPEVEPVCAESDSRLGSGVLPGLRFQWLWCLRCACVWSSQNCGVQGVHGVEDRGWQPCSWVVAPQCLWEGPSSISQRSSDCWLPQWQKVLVSSVEQAAGVPSNKHWNPGLLRLLSFFF